MYAFLEDKQIIAVSGLDSEKFLNGLLTNLVDNRQITYAMMLSPQGRYLCDFFIYPQAQSSYLLEVPKNADILGKLKLYRMRSKVELEDVSSSYICLYSRDLLPTNSYKDPRYSQLGYKSIIQSAQLANIKLVLQPNLYLEDKYQFCIPDGATDFIINKSFPQEYGADFLNAISYTKGCYVGQEVIARTKYQGMVRKKIHLIQAQYSLNHLLQGDKITIEGQEVGILCSVFDNKGIALVRCEQEKEERYFADVCGIAVNLSLAPWYASLT